MKILELLGDFSYFACRSLGYSIRSLFRPRQVFEQLYSILLGALPVGFVAGIALGSVVWMHLYGALKRTNAEETLPTYLSVAVLLELAPIAAGLILAARTGAALGAELGAMKQTEQIDALEMLGVAPFSILVGPRVLACAIAIPLLHIFIATLALLSGYIADFMISNTSWLQYQRLCLDKLFAADVIPAGMKTIVFGFFVGVAGCFHGFHADGGTEGVGRAATQGVVTASLLVLVSDVVLVAIIQLFR